MCLLVIHWKDNINVWVSARNACWNRIPPPEALPPENFAGTARGFPGDRQWDGPFQMPSDESHFSEVVVELCIQIPLNKHSAGKIPWTQYKNKATASLACISSWGSQVPPGLWPTWSLSCPLLGCGLSTLFHNDFWETARTVFKVLPNTAEEILTDSAILRLMNMHRLCRASLHSCQDLWPRVTSAVQEEEEGKAANEKVLSVISWMRWFDLSRSSCLLASRAALQSGAAELPQHKSFSDPKEKFPREELGGCETSVSAKALISMTPWELLPWLLTRVGWHSSHLLQWINLSCL